MDKKPRAEAEFYKNMDPVTLSDMFLSLLDQSSDALFLKDREGKYLALNQAAARVLGRSREQILGRDDYEILDGPSAKSRNKGDRQVLATGLPVKEDIKITVAGVTRIQQTELSPYRDSRDGIVGILGRARDITSQFLDQKALDLDLGRESEPQTDPEAGYWEMDFSRQEIRLSKSACRLYGLSDGSETHALDEVLSIIHPDDQALEERVRREALLGEQPYVVEYRVAPTTGDTRFLSVVGEVQFDHSGRSVSAHGMVYDVTAQRQAELDLRRSEHILRLVLEALPVAVQVMNLRGDIFLSNAAGEKIWGKIICSGQKRYTAVKGYWHDTQELIKPEEWASQRAINEGKTSHNEKIDIDAFDGERRTILNSAVPIRDKNQDIIGAVIINEDITDRLRLESQLIQAQKMEAIGQLAGGLAHDFNNLLTVVSGCGELLFEGLEKTDANGELVEEILNAAEQATGLTKQLLAFSRQTVLQPKVVQLNKVVAESEHMLRRLIPENIIFKVRLDPAAGSVRVDPVQLGQVLMNLSVNARDAMPNGGRLEIETLATPESRSFETITVTDTGEGMSEKVKGHIFEPFFSTKPQGRGTGLGLATVYGIIRQSGGDVTVESTPGRGSRFTIRLPSCDDHSTVETTPTSRHGGSAGSESILLVEDQESVRTMLGVALERKGYKVTLATQGHQALEFWERQGPFDLIVTDVVMPEMGGQELVEKLRITEPKVKVLFMSGYTTDALFRTGIEREKVAFLPKPFSLNELESKIRDLLDDPSSSK